MSDTTRRRGELSEAGDVLPDIEKEEARGEAAEEPVLEATDAEGRGAALPKSPSREGGRAEGFEPTGQVSDLPTAESLTAARPEELVRDLGKASAVDRSEMAGLEAALGANYKEEQ